jgi:hypothetical protein
MNCFGGKRTYVWCNAPTRMARLPIIAPLKGRGNLLIV